MHSTAATPKLTAIDGGGAASPVNVPARRRQLKAQSLRRLSEHVPEVAAVAVRRRACELDLEAFALGALYGQQPLSA